MSETEKGCITYTSDNQMKSQIVHTFEGIYERIDPTDGGRDNVALFSHLVDGRLVALSITPKAVSFCRSLFGPPIWERSNENTPNLGVLCWEAGDKRLDPSA